MISEDSGDAGEIVITLLWVIMVVMSLFYNLQVKVLKWLKYWLHRTIIDGQNTNQSEKEALFNKGCRKIEKHQIR